MQRGAEPQPTLPGLLHLTVWGSALVHEVRLPCSQLSSVPSSPGCLIRAVWKSCASSIRSILSTERCPHSQGALLTPLTWVLALGLRAVVPPLVSWTSIRLERTPKHWDTSW